MKSWSALLKCRKGTYSFPVAASTTGGGEGEAVLWIRWVEIRCGDKNGFRGKRCATIDGFPETQLASGELKAGPGDIDVVATHFSRIGANGKPFLVTRVILLHDHAGAPSVAAVSGFVDLNGPVGLVGGQVGEIEVAMPVNSNRGIAESFRRARRGRHLSSLPGLAAVIGTLER